MRDWWLRWTHWWPRRCVKCHRIIWRPVLLRDEGERCYRCADPE